MTKFRTLVATICCLLAVFAVSIASAASTDRAKELVATTQRTMELAKNYHATIAFDTTMTVQGKNIQTKVNGDMDMFVNPLLAKTKMDMSFLINDKEKSATILQYMEQSGSQALIYSCVDGKWQKQSVPIGTVNPTQGYENYLKQIKSATIVSENQDSVVIEAVIDGKYLKETLQKNTGSLEFAKFTTFADDLLRSIGDMTYTITINKKTMTVSEMYMDLSEPLQRFGLILVDGAAMPDDKKEQLREMFRNIQMHMRMTMTQYNEIKPFTIPDEARSA